MLLRPQIRRQDAISTYFALAKELEDIGEYEESFAALSEGNRIKRSTLDYDVRNDVAAMQKVMAHYTRDALAQATAGRSVDGPDLHRGHAAHGHDAGRAHPRQPLRRRLARRDCRLSGRK